MKNEWDAFYENEYSRLMQARQIYEARLPEELKKKYLKPPEPEVVEAKMEVETTFKKVHLPLEPLSSKSTHPI